MFRLIPSSGEPIENEIWRRDPLLRQVGDSWTGRVCPAIRYLKQVLKTAGQSDIWNIWMYWYRIFEGGCHNSKPIWCTWIFGCLDTLGLLQRDCYGTVKKTVNVCVCGCDDADSGGSSWPPIIWHCQSLGPDYMGQLVPAIKTMTKAWRSYIVVLKKFSGNGLLSAITWHHYYLNGRTATLR